MENSCNNRYELLFMDDESMIAPIPPKQIPGPGKKKKGTSVHSISIKNEKENKINMLNKSTTKIGNQYTGPKGNISVSNGIKELRTKNVRMTGSEKIHSNLSEYNNELPQRHIRDRDSKAPRFRGNEKFGKREFDRQSGSDKTGIKSVDKRDGAGAHNWGSAKQDIEELKSGNAATVGDKEDSANEQSGEPTNNLEDDESKQMTLDEWKALKDQRAKPNFNLRKAGEGVDNSEWKKMTVLSKKKEIDTEDELEYDPSMYPQRVGRIQRIVDIQFNFNDGRKTGFRKGPRAPARGGHREESAANIGFEKIPSYKFAKQHRAGSKSLKVDDEIQFPTLS